MGIFTRFRKKKQTGLSAAALERLRKKEVSGGNRVVKEIVRGDEKERVCIFERTNRTFGIKVQHRVEDTDAWFTHHSPSTGAAYDSVETAEREAAVAVSWLREKKGAQPAATANALTRPAISRSARPLDDALSFEENRLRAPARS